MPLSPWRWHGTEPERRSCPLFLPCSPPSVPVSFLSPPMPFRRIPLPLGFAQRQWKACDPGCRHRLQRLLPGWSSSASPSGPAGSPCTSSFRPASACTAPDEQRPPAPYPDIPKARLPSFRQYQQAAVSNHGPPGLPPAASSWLHILMLTQKAILSPRRASSSRKTCTDPGTLQKAALQFCRAAGTPSRQLPSLKSAIVCSGFPDLRGVEEDTPWSSPAPLI